MFILGPHGPGVLSWLYSLSVCPSVSPPISPPVLLLNDDGRHSAHPSISQQWWIYIYVLWSYKLCTQSCFGYKADSRLAPNQWETLQCNAISYWLDAKLESALWLYHQSVVNPCIYPYSSGLLHWHWGMIACLWFINLCCSAPVSNEYTVMSLNFIELIDLKHWRKYCWRSRSIYLLH